MKHNYFSPVQNQKPASVAQPIAAKDLNPRGIDFPPSRDEVAKRAYFIYVNAGLQSGHDMQHWLQAEAQLLAEHNPARSPVPGGDESGNASSEGDGPVKEAVPAAPTYDFQRVDSESKTPAVPVRQSKPKTDLKPAAGLWIDHRRAVIAIVSDEGKETLLEIKSNVEKQAGRLAGVRSTTPYESLKVRADDSHEREFTGHLNQFYAEVIAAIRGIESILLFGPGEAKEELKKRLERNNPRGRIIAVETADKMTDRQIAAKVREHFHE
jgi:hypothetical protein